MKLDSYLVEQLFIKFDSLDGPVYYRPHADDGNGYIVVWPKGEDEVPDYHHTYHFPPEVWGIQ